jgi:hypothetical protein
MECNVECAQTKAVRQDYLTRSCVLTSISKHSINLNTMLEEHHILLSLHKNDLNMREAKLAEEEVHNIYSFDGR